jgi:uncharacterized membrane protein YdbT with pleckstrin-like domain
MEMSRTIGGWIMAITGTILQIPNSSEFVPEFLKWGENLNETIQLIYAFFGVIMIILSAIMLIIRMHYTIKEKELDLKIKTKGFQDYEDLQKKLKDAEIR